MVHNLAIDITGILRETLNLFFQRRIIWACSILGGFYGVLMILFFALVIFAALLTAGDGSFAEYEWQVTKYSIIAVLLCFPLHLPVVRFIKFAASDAPRARLVFNFRVMRDDLIAVALIHACVLMSSGSMYLGYLWLSGEIVTSNWFTVLVLSPVISSLTIPLILPATTFAVHEQEAWHAARQWLSRGGAAMVTAYLLLSTLIAVVLVLPDGLSGVLKIPAVRETVHNTGSPYRAALRRVTDNGERRVTLCDETGLFDSVPCNGGANATPYTADALLHRLAREVDLLEVDGTAVGIGCFTYPADEGGDAAVNDLGSIAVIGNRTVEFLWQFKNRDGQPILDGLTISHPSAERSAIYEANRGGGCGATAVQNRIWAFNGETEGA